MKNILKFILLTSLISCQSNNATGLVIQKTSEQIQTVKQDSLFILDIKLNENFVRITVPKNSDFEFPDSSAKTEPYKFGDFNADKKEYLSYI